MLGMLSEQTISSIQVAEMMGKNHADLLRDIVKYTKYFTQSNFAFSDFFIKSEYKDPTGRMLPCYQITRKGCEFLAHKMTGQKGAMFTAWYIEAFHKMQEQNREEQSFPLAETVDQLLRSQMVMADAMERILQRLEEPKHLLPLTPRDEIIYEGEMERLLTEQRRHYKGRKRLLVETFPPEIQEMVDALLSDRGRNFRFIARVLNEKGYRISWYAVQHYFRCHEERLLGGGLNEQ